MVLQKYNKGDISLPLLLKFVFGALLALLVNGIFDSMVGSIYTGEVQLMATSPRVQAAQQCIYLSIMDGSYSRLSSCNSKDSAFIGSSSPVKVSLDGEIYLEEDIKGTSVSLVLKPVLTSNGGVEWECSGAPEKYMPTSCSSNH